MNKYNKRTWLDNLSHSTAHIVCYFDKECLNNSLTLFIKIADCSDGWYLIDNGSNKYTNNPKKSIDFITKLINVFNDVLNDLLTKEKINNKVFNIQKNNIKLTLYKEDELINLKILTRSGEFISFGNRRKYKWKTRVYLHADKTTCNKHVFISKIKIIINDLQKFKKFIITF